MGFPGEAFHNFPHLSPAILLRNLLTKNSPILRDSDKLLIVLILLALSQNFSQNNSLPVSWIDHVVSLILVPNFFGDSLKKVRQFTETGICRQ